MPSRSPSRSGQLPSASTPSRPGTSDRPIEIEEEDDIVAPAIEVDANRGAAASVSADQHDDDEENDEIREVDLLTDAESSSSRGEILLLVFIHGFKGSAETTFLDFPSRIAHLVRETHTGLNVIPLIYPTYDTRGSLATAVSNFVEWLTLQTLQLESKPGPEGRGQGRGSVKIALCGHSMGGLVAVDAALRIADENASMGEKSSANGGEMTELWPRVVSVIAYDSPFYGVHPNVFKNQATKYISYAQQVRGVGSHFAPMAAGLAAAWGMNRNRSTTTNNNRGTTQQAQGGGGGWAKLAGLVGGTSTSSSSSSSQAASTGSTSSSGWNTALWATGVLATAATAGGVAAYYNREQIGGAYGYLTEHFEYVSNLWDDKGLRQRLDALIDLPSILFHAYYNRLPPQTSSFTNAFQQDSRPRTFIILPPLSSHASRLFTPLDNTVSPDEVSAHIAMFSGKPNENNTFVQMGRRTADVLGEVIRGWQADAADNVIGGTRSGDEGAFDGNTGGERRRGMMAGQGRMEEEESIDGQEDGLRSGDVGLEGEEEDVRREMREAKRRSESADLFNDKE